MLKAIVCGVLISWISFVATASESDVSLNLSPIKVGAHSYYVKGFAGVATEENQGFMSNAGFVVTNAGVVVFDTLGTPVLAKILVAEIKKITSQPIKQVIISHYHADHIYGMQVFKALGAEIWAHVDGQDYIGSDEAIQRLEQRREVLKPWVDESTVVLAADKWLDGDTSFEMGGIHFELRHVGPAHSLEDLAMYVQEDRVLYSGDLVFKGRVPFVGSADSRLWLEALDKLIATHPKFMIPGHGFVSVTPIADLQMTRDYLKYLRDVMGHAVKTFMTFDDAYAQADWSNFSKLPAFFDANRANAFNTYLLMEKELFSK